MSGFEPDRFVNYSSIDFEDFMCGICHGILIKPVVTNCCQQTYCSQCINKWINQSNTCPNDRRSLTSKQLRPSPRAFVNLLDNLKITCDYKSEGCLSVVKFSDLNNHIKECEYRPNTVCKVCQIMRESVSTHNCVESLMIEKNKIVAKNEENYKVYQKDLLLQCNTFEQEMDALNEEFKTEMNKMVSKFKNRIDNLKTANVMNFAKLQKVEFTSNCDQNFNLLRKEVEGLVRDNKSNDEIQNYISIHFNASQTSDHKFISALFSGVIRACIYAPTDANVDNYFTFEKTLLQPYSPLICKFLGGDPERELQALIALQELIDELQHPPGLLLKIFTALFDQFIISQEAFLQWEKSDNNRPVKAVAVKSVTSFFTWLSEPDAVDDYEIQ